MPPAPCSPRVCSPISPQAGRLHAGSSANHFVTGVSCIATDILTTCRNEKLITDAEFQHGRDFAVSSFSTDVGNGQPYTEDFAGLHAELVQLASLKKNQVLSDDTIADIRKRIILRYQLEDQSP